MNATHRLAAGLCLAGSLLALPASDPLRVGAAAIPLEADDAMVIAGGIHPGKASGQEGELRATAVVVRLGSEAPLAIISCDILMITRRYLDPATAEITRQTGIPASHILIHATHTHHAPSTLTLHGYDTDDTFARRVQDAIVEAAVAAHENLGDSPCTFHFHLAHEATVGQNSRQLLPDGSIYWIGPRDQFVRPTGPFDPELPILAFRDEAQRWKAILFNHSTHTIGTIRAGVRSPSFYGLAAQRVEKARGGVAAFLQGASGSTHNLTLSGAAMTDRIEQTLLEGLEEARPRPVTRLDARKRPFTFRVRHFEEEAEEEAVSRYCRKWVGPYGAQVIPVFRNMRQRLAPQQGEERQTWVQAMRIGDIALVGVPAELFTKLGLDIKNRSPFRYTYVAELANDWIGYLPDRDAHRLGGYQVWTGFHSYAEPGTGERMVDAVLDLLHQLAAEHPPSPHASFSRRPH